MAIKKIKVGNTTYDIQDANAYVKPSGGIPSSDMASAVQTSLGKADSAYQKPSGGIPKTDLASPSPFVAGTGSSSAVLDGGSNTCSGKFGTAEGYNCHVGYDGIVNVMEYGDELTAGSGNYSHAEGNACIACGPDSHAEGRSTFARGSAHSEGRCTSAYGAKSHVEGFITSSNGENSHAEGHYTHAKGQDSHVECGGWTVGLYVSGDAGTTTYTGKIPLDQVYNDVDFSLFKNCIICKGNGSTYNFGFHSLVSSITKTGIDSNYIYVTINTVTTLSENEALIDEQFILPGSLASTRSHVEGIGCITTNTASHAEGNHTVALNNYEHAEGSYNKPNRKTDGTDAQNAAGSTIHSVGIGTSENDRKNAFEIMQNGDVYVKGVGGYDGTNAGAESARKVQDVLPNNTEHIYVVCRACSGTYGSMSRVSTQGGTVHFKLWNPATCEEKEESYAIPSNGVVEAYIPFGTVYQVWSTKSGYGASFRPVFTASNANGGTKYVHLWNLPTGVFKMAGAAFCADDGNSYRVSPLISTDGSQDWWEGDEEWDSGNGDAYDYEVSGLSDDYLEDAFDLGIVVSTANVSVLVQPSAKADSTLAWSFQGYGRTIPGLEEYFESHGHNYEDAQYFATYDYDGNLNTFKILDFLVEAPAVEFASQNKSYTFSNWYLPSAGELKTLYNNKSAYNAIQSDYSDVPALDSNWYWSSCAYSPYYSWGVTMYDGGVDRNDRYLNDYDVLAVSAFLFKY